MPNYNLTGQKIKDTYSQLAQVSGSTLVDGLGVAAPITTASITNFPTEVSRSAAAAGFGQGTGGVSEATFTAYTSSNDAVVATKLGTSTFNAYTSSNDAIVSLTSIRVGSLESATGSYALKTAISGAFTSLSSSLSTRLTNDETSISSLNSATSSYALKTAISGAFTLPSGVVSSSTQVLNYIDSETITPGIVNVNQDRVIINTNTGFGVLYNDTGTGLILADNPGLAQSIQLRDDLGRITYRSNPGGLGGGLHEFVTGSVTIVDDVTINKKLFLNDAQYDSVSIGKSSIANGRQSVVVGTNTSASGTGSISIGSGAKAYSDYSVVIGNGANDSDSSRVNAVVIGRNATSAQNSIAIGYGVQSYSDSGVGIGRDVKAYANDGVAIGYLAECGVGFSAARSIAIGYDTSANAPGAIALGASVTAQVQDYTTTNYLQLIQVTSSMGVNGYADDAAAATAGVPLGGVYHTSGSLKIRVS